MRQVPNPTPQQRLGNFMQQRQEAAWLASQNKGGPVADPAAKLLADASDLFQQRRYAESAALFQQVKGTALLADQGHFGLGAIALATGDTAGAAQHFEAAIGINPNYANARFYLGEICEKSGRSDAALAHYRVALTREPAHAGALKAMARLGQVAQTPVGAPAAPRAQLGVFEYLRTDSTLLAQQAVAQLESLSLRRRAGLTAWLGRLVSLALVLFALIVVEAILQLSYGFEFNDSLLWVGAAVILGASALRNAGTVYELSAGRLTVTRGIIFRRVRQLELWRVQNIERRQGALDRITGHGELRFVAVASQGSTIKARGLARGKALTDLHNNLVDLVFLLRSSPVVKGIIS